jgi:hypothetical protein
MAIRSVPSDRRYESASTRESVKKVGKDVESVEKRVEGCRREWIERSKALGSQQQKVFLSTLNTQFNDLKGKMEECSHLKQADITVICGQVMQALDKNLVTAFQDAARFDSQAHFLKKEFDRVGSKIDSIDLDFAELEIVGGTAAGATAGWLAGPRGPNLPTGRAIVRAATGAVVGAIATVGAVLFYAEDVE